MTISTKFGNDYFPSRRHIVVGIILLSSSFHVFARCEDGRREVATQLVVEARALTDDIEKLVKLKRSIKSCPEFVTWIELGKVNLDLENFAGAASAFESARDFYQPTPDGGFSRSVIRRQSISSGWLADSYQRTNDLASASVATQEAANGFKALGLPVPARLVSLQATIDDALASADASVLARSLEIQYERATRGIGVRPSLSNTVDAVEVVAETDEIEADYTGQGAGDSLATLNESSKILGSGEGNVVAIPKPETQIGTESRLNIPVLFDYDSAELSMPSKQTVEQLGRALNILGLEASASVVIVGHTDSQGAAGYNRNLSLRRANTVLAAIRKLVQSEVEYEVMGKGEESLRYNGNTADDHRRNRRVEIIVRR